MAFLCLTPFVWMILASFKNFKELVSSTNFLPEVWTLNNYREIISRVNFPVAFLNSILSATSVTAVTLFTSAALGYIFAKYRFWGKEQLFAVLLSTIMVPFAVVLVPLLLLVLLEQAAVPKSATHSITNALERVLDIATLT